mmetsp:Transcript_9322/g.29053  ORF Transcript_9322/g.29053 Transcript_9322/m.29053 type:complete len:317 (-) Transcript_9322:148-1098(-)
MQLERIVLYALGTFVCYPWKPLLNAVLGSAYDVAWRHFRHDHSEPTNVLMHGVVLFLQLHANVQLLARADVWLETAVPALAGRRAVAFLTFALWSLALARGCKGCPAAPKAAAVGAVLAAYAAGPMLPPVVQMERFCALAFAALLGSRAVLAAARGDMRGAGRWAFQLGKTSAIAAGWLAAWRFTYERAVPWLIAAGRMPQGMSVHAAVAACLIAASSLRDPVKTAAIVGAIVLRADHALTGSPAARALAGAFLGTILQGVAHRTTMQGSTLELLNSKSDKAKERELLSFEWAHVCFFPCLTMHAVFLLPKGPKAQ